MRMYAITGSGANQGFDVIPPIGLNHALDKQLQRRCDTLVSSRDRFLQSVIAVNE